MRLVHTILETLYKAAGVLSGVSLVFLCLLVLYSILARLFGFFAGGATDVAGYVMATSTFLAFAYTFRRNGHIRVQLLTRSLTGTKRRLVNVLCLAIMSGATAFVAFYMTRLAMESYDVNERSEGVDAILLWIPQTPVALGAILLAVAVFHTFWLSLFDDEGDTFEKQNHEGPNQI